MLMINPVEFTVLLWIFLGIYILNIFVRMVLEKLNINHLKSLGDIVPESFEDVIDKKILSKMRDYTLANNRLGSVENLVSDFLILAIVLSGFLPWLVSLIQKWDLHFVISGLIFFFSCSLIMGVVDIPFDLYRNFVLEKRFSFSTLTFSLWCTDLIKSLVISVIMMGTEIQT